MQYAASFSSKTDTINEKLYPVHLEFWYIQPCQDCYVGKVKKRFIQVDSTEKSTSFKEIKQATPLSNFISIQTMFPCIEHRNFTLQHSIYHSLLNTLNPQKSHWYSKLL